MKKIVYLFGSIILFSLMSGCEDTNPTDLLDARDAFLGTWTVSESCAKDSYSVTIVKDQSNSSQVIIQNFYHIVNCSNPPYAIIAGSSIVIPTQSICGDAFEVSGTGKLDKGKITMTYSVNDGADLFNCGATLQQ